MRKLIMFLISLVIVGAYMSTVYAQELGCCTNPNAGAFTCTNERLVRRTECCPVPESNFRSYYSNQPFAPNSSADCNQNYFFENQACSSLDQCTLGCCCAQTGGSIRSRIQCQNTSVFYEGNLDCNTVCPSPECSDGLDNDNNGCADFENGDTGCSGATDNTESGGSCSNTGPQCNNPSYRPRITSLSVLPKKGEKKFDLSWTDECTQTASHYEIYRCSGECTTSTLLGSGLAVNYTDDSDELSFGVTYNYRVVAYYQVYAATSSANRSGSLGNEQCLGRYTNEAFCSNNSAYSCDLENRLNSRGLRCSSSQVCIARGDSASCANRISCNYNEANPFGLFYTQQGCENGRYCFYDRSNTNIDSCFGCSERMSCYDYKSSGACSRDNCRIGSCRWEPISQDIGLGVCVSTNSYNCNFCGQRGTQSLENARSYNDIFDVCTLEKSEALSTSGYRCFYSNGTSKSCNNVVCRDYGVEGCNSDQIRIDSSNIILNPSNDQCGIGTCQRIGESCVKNADGNQDPDCNSSDCELDYFPPNTTLQFSFSRGIPNAISVSIRDKTAPNSSYIFRTSSNYTTYFCSGQCTPNISTTARRLIISGLAVFDGQSGRRLMILSEGQNNLHFYSKDPSNNLEIVKRISFEAHANTSSPRVRNINVSNGTILGNVVYTNSRSPRITVNFLEPAFVTFIRLSRQGSSLSIDPVGSTGSSEAQLSYTYDFPQLEDGTYLLQINARNTRNIYMDRQSVHTIILDTVPPNISIIPRSNDVLNSTPIPIILQFSEDVHLDYARLQFSSGGSVNTIPISLSTTNNRVFSGQANTTDGNKILQVMAHDFAGNTIRSQVGFTVDINPLDITLASPRYGVSANSVFDLVVETDNNARCRHSLDTEFEYEYMEQFPQTGQTRHVQNNYNEIGPNDLTVHRLYVKCRDSRNREVSRQFSLSVDRSEPVIRNYFAYPGTIVELPASTTLSIESDEPVICRYSQTEVEFARMERGFHGYDTADFRTTNSQNVNISEGEGLYRFNAACLNRAGLISNTSNITVVVDLSSVLTILSRTQPRFNTTSIALVIETNKRSQCLYSQTDPLVNSGTLFGTAGYMHRRNLVVPNGNNTFYVKCRDSQLQRYSEVLAVSFVVDSTAPSMEYVDDTVLFTSLPEVSCLRDRLWLSLYAVDNETAIREYSYSLLRRSDNRIIINNSRTTIGGEPFLVSNLNLSNNAQYYFSGRSVNLGGLESSSRNSDGVSINVTACDPPPPAARCGDGRVNNGSEQCDGSDLGGITCRDFTNYVDGALTCTGSCRYNTSRCVAANLCGNGVIDTNEQCDGTNLGRLSGACSNFSPSFASGNLRCDPQRCELITSDCVEGPSCGNGVINTGEQCDGTNFGRNLSGACINYSNYFTGGNLNCNTCAIGTSNCQGISGGCGNNVININEDCDGAVFGSVDQCQDLGFSNGTLACSSSCQLDTSGCIERQQCGNGLINRNEDCDGTNFGYLSNRCTDLSRDYAGGILSCTSLSCQLNTSQCTPSPMCGNARLDTGEQCDGTNFGNRTNLSCSLYGNFVNGTVACSSSCMLSRSACVNIDSPQNRTNTTITCRTRGDCPANSTCTINAECSTRFCLNARCANATCSDNLKNQQESDIDCAGPCPRCQNGKSCSSNNDCSSGNCNFGSCAEPDKCYDGQLTPGEADTDCGGPCLTRCSEGRNCDSDSSCENGLECIDSRCKRNTPPEEEQPAITDRDGDGLPDEWEIENGLNPDDPQDAAMDNDGDGLDNLAEYENGTDPNNADTDGDAFGDKIELDSGTNPLDPQDFPKSSLWTTITIITGILLLVSGFGYLGYTMIQKKSVKGSFTQPVQRFDLKREPYMPPRQPIQGLQRPIIKRRNEEKETQIKHMFDVFDEKVKNIEEPTDKGQEEKPADTKSLEAKGTKEEKKLKKSKPKKSKDDVFQRLKEISKESKGSKKPKRKKKS